jgi:hypothetical protein
MGRGAGGYIPEEILLHPDNPRLAGGYDPDSGEDDASRNGLQNIWITLRKIYYSYERKVARDC